MATTIAPQTDSIPPVPTSPRPTPTVGRRESVGERISRNFGKISHVSLLIYCATAALSIALHQTAVVVAVLSWLFFRAHRSTDGVSDQRILSGVAYPILCWVTISYISTVLGVNPERAIPEVLKSSFYVLLPFCLYDSLVSTGLSFRQTYDRILLYLSVLFAGQAAASLHSVLSEIVGTQLPPRVPGPVTESGQLVLLFPLLAVLILSSDEGAGERRRRALFLAFALAVLGILVSWPHSLGLERLGIVHGSFILLFITALAAAALQWKTDLQTLRHFGLLSLWTGGALLFSAFVVNLKRGPWFAVFVQFIILGAIYSRRLFIAVIACSALLFAGVEPIRTRALDFVADFSISGGRQNMWELGVELAKLYPLGLGPDNAEFMRQVDPTLPPTHRHMHNNMLNVAVESGWIGLASYLWWIVAVLTIAGTAWWRAKALEPYDDLIPSFHQCRSVCPSDDMSGGEKDLRRSILPPFCLPTFVSRVGFTKHRTHVVGRESGDVEGLKCFG